MRALADPASSGRAGRSSGRWADLGRRSATAAVLAPVALLCVWAGGWGWQALVLAGAVGLAYEWSALCGQPGGRLGQAVLTLAALGATVLAPAGQGRAAVLVLLCGAVGAWLSARSATMVAGVVYVGVPLAAIAWLRGAGAAQGTEAGRADVVFLIVVVWASDIGAYVAGRLLGGPKLAPSISPGKTRSGAVGGLVAAMVVGAAAAELMAPGHPVRAAGIAAVLGVVSQAGDLLESWIKRRFGVKDSGWLIPGHGGLLDRLDGLLAAAPAAACIAATAGRGSVLWS